MLQLLIHESMDELKNELKNCDQGATTHRHQAYRSYNGL